MNFSTAQPSAPWEQFCKDEARSSAASFLHRVDEYKRRDHEAREIPEVAFAKEFAAEFVEAVLALSTGDQKSGKNHRTHQTSKTKTWWNIFKIGKQKGDEGVSDYNRSGGRSVVFESLASHLIIGEPLSWKSCRLAITVDHGHSQIEVYTPPKFNDLFQNVVPKMSLFCFMIESVRTATLLEAPDSHFAFIIKCHQKGEYIFDVESKEIKDKWLQSIEAYCSHKGAVLGVLAEPATKDGEAHSPFHGSNGIPRGGTVGEDLLQLRSHTSRSPATRRRKTQSVLIESRPHSPILLPSNHAAASTTSDPLLIVNVMSQLQRASPPSTELTSSARDSHTPENTNCSHSSSSSALHPVSIAAAQRLTPNTNHQRKSSAPSLLAPSPVHNSNAGWSIPIVTVDVPRSCSNDPLYLNTHPPQSVGNQPTTHSKCDSGGGNSTTQSFAMHSEAVALETPQNETTTQLSDPQTNIGSTPVYIETAEVNVSDSSWAKSDRDVGNLRVLSQYPWFHGLISRTLATDLVLSGNDETSGKYLVRQSESREGDFVLTFNYRNRAKHLRLTLNENGCNIQHLWFDDVPKMLDHFKTNSIPLESYWLNEDVKLTTYIERSASDAFRTPTVVNPSRVQRMPPRRSHSLHISTSRRTTTTTPTPTNQVEELHSTSLPHSARHATEWRQLFHSHSSGGSISQQQIQSGTSLLESQHSSSRDRVENNYVYRS